jgi:hypothetical protein
LAATPYLHTVYNFMCKIRIEALRRKGGGGGGDIMEEKCKAS